MLETFFAVLLTAGLWLLTVPFYPMRCIVCGLTKSDSLPWYKTWGLGLVLVVGLIVFHTGINSLFRPRFPVMSPSSISPITANPASPPSAGASATIPLATKRNIGEAAA